MTGSADQLSIESIPAGGIIPEGRHERALRATVATATHIGPAHAAAVSVATALARALDVAETRGDATTPTQAARSYLDALERLGLLPDPDDAAPAPRAGGDADGSADPMGEFGRPSLVHTA